MPTSRPAHISWLCDRVISLQPKSVLDIGCGSGAKGVLFREYTDIWNGRYKKPLYTTRIDAVEGFEDYVQGLHRFVYDNVYVCDIRDFVFPQSYDLIYAGDIIEHLSKEDGARLLCVMSRFAIRSAIVATPIVVSNQLDVNGNDLERHISQWVPADFPGWRFQRFGNTQVYEFVK